MQKRRMSLDEALGIGATKPLKNVGLYLIEEETRVHVYMQKSKASKLRYVCSFETSCPSLLEEAMKVNPN